MFCIINADVYVTQLEQPEMGWSQFINLTSSQAVQHSHDQCITQLTIPSQFSWCLFCEKVEGPSLETQENSCSLKGTPPGAWLFITHV